MHVSIGKRIYWVLALVALLALTGAAVTMTTRFTSAEGPGPTTAVTPSDQQGEVDDANEADDDAESAVKEADTDNVGEQSGDQNAADNGAKAGNASTDTVVPCSDPTGTNDAAEEANAGPDTDNIEEQCGDQNAAEDGDVAAPSGTLDDGKDLLPQAGITIDKAIAAAQTAASGSVGEIDLEQYQGKLAFNVDVGDKDVKVDAADGIILAADSDD